jgi:Sec-independent protein translocase protein TatA
MHDGIFKASILIALIVVLVILGVQNAEKVPAAARQAASNGEINAAAAGLIQPAEAE